MREVGWAADWIRRVIEFECWCGDVIGIRSKKSRSVVEFEPFILLLLVSSSKLLVKLLTKSVSR